MQKNFLSGGGIARGGTRHIAKALLFMKLTFLLLTTVLLQVSARSLSQEVSFKGENVPLETVFTSLEKQTGYVFVYSEPVLRSAKVVTITAAREPLVTFLKRLFASQSLTYTIKNKTIFITKTRKEPARAPGKGNDIVDQFVNPADPIKIIVTDSAGNPLSGASVMVKNAKRSGITNNNGWVNLEVKEGEVLVVSYVGYETQHMLMDVKSAGSSGRYDQDGNLVVKLKPAVAKLEEVAVVVNTGYQQIPKERATGSFEFVSQKDLRRSVSVNILDRLEGVASGFLIDRSAVDIQRPGGAKPKVRVRGLSTIKSNSEPLIIVDNFPYENDISTINPMDVENITILKDAAAASIWGARAGNGVIVITTKNGKFNQTPKVSLSSILSVTDKPDIYYYPNFVASADVLKNEEALFVQSFYTIADRTVLPLYVEALIKHRNGQLTDTELAAYREELSGRDTRSEMEKYIYQHAFRQQHTVNVSGGSQRYAYRLGLSGTQGESFVIGDDDKSLTLNFNNTFRVGEKMTIQGSMWYTEQRKRANGIRYTDLSYGQSLYPYLKLQDEDGNALAVPKDLRYAFQESAESKGLLNWMYRPLEERDATDNVENNKEIRINGGFQYQVLPFLQLSGTYQYNTTQSGTNILYRKNSYYVRDLVNKFTQASGEKIIPYGNIMRVGSPGTTLSHSGRLMLNGSNSWNNKEHELVYLAGAEIRTRVQRQSPFIIVYDYDEELLSGRTNFNYATRYSQRPSGTALIPGGSGSYSLATANFLSYFTNMSYNWRGKYMLSGSMRWDASNIYGVKTNQKGVPLWSIGASWDLNKEPFFKQEALSSLRARVTYGSSGNTNSKVTTFPVLYFNTDSYTQLPSATFRSVGNPSLRWEKVNTINAGIDFTVRGQVLSGSVEYFKKYAEDLIGADLMDPTTGIIDQALPVIENNINYANLSSTGWELRLNSRNLRGALSWNTQLLLSYAVNKVTHYATNEVKEAAMFIAERLPVKGSSLDVIYAYPWNGLDNQGRPVIYKDGEISTDFINYYNGYAIEDLVKLGVRVPPMTGSLLNVIGYKGFEFSFNLMFKTGYYVKRQTMTPTGEFYRAYHKDYYKRWEKPGDEVFTDVLPKSNVITPEVNAIGGIQGASKLLWEKGDHVRLQDVSLSYQWQHPNIRNWFKRIQVSLTANNLGVIWRKNKYGIDPDYVGSIYPIPSTMALGINLDF